jgi:branched-chain amino acid transport system ATP-binding protein
MTIVKEINQRLGITVIMVEHVIKAVVGLCDKVIVLHYGRKIAEGTPKEVTENPAVIEAYFGESIET